MTFNRTSLPCKSFIPPVDNLQDDVNNILKQYRSLDCPTKHPLYMYYHWGSRNMYILQTILHQDYRALNYDLHKLNWIENLVCQALLFGMYSV